MCAAFRVTEMLLSFHHAFIRLPGSSSWVCRTTITQAGQFGVIETQEPEEICK